MTKNSEIEKYAQLLWDVLVKANGGTWDYQDEDWKKEIIKSRNLYFKAISGCEVKRAS